MRNHSPSSGWRQHLLQHPQTRRHKSLVLDTPSFKVAKILLHSPSAATTKSMIGLEFSNMNTTDLLKDANIYARDLLTLNVTSKQENLEPRFAQRTPAAIVPRGNLILISFGNIRAVVGLDSVHVLDAHRPAVQDFATDMARVFQLQHEEEQNESSDQHTQQPHELVFLEGLLRDTVESFNRRVQLYEPIIEDFLGRVSDEVYSDTGVHQLVPLKDSLQSFEIQVKQSVECLAALLDDDEAMLQLLLTEQDAAQRNRVAVDFARHEHVELLLGVYARQLSMILMEIQFLLGRLQSKQEFVALALDSYRNRLVRINVHVSIFGLSLAVGTTVAGFFGMNLVSGLEADPVAFGAVVGGTSLVGAAVALTTLNYISGSTLKRRAEQRLQEIETLTAALSDMCALDYTLKRIVERERSQHTLAHDSEEDDKGNAKKASKPMDMGEFRELVRSARRSRTISDREVNLLFGVFDKVRDGVISTEDLTFLEVMRHSSSSTMLIPSSSEPARSSISSKANSKGEAEDEKRLG